MRCKVHGLSGEKISGRMAYGVNVVVENDKEYEIWKSLEEYKQLEAILRERTFDVDKYFQKTNIRDQKQIMQRVVEFVQFCFDRHDILNSHIFRQFARLEPVECEYLEEWSRVNVGSADMKIIDFCWDPTQMVLISLEKQNNSIKKITNFFKTMLSQPSKTGILKVWQENKKWDKIHEISLEAQPVSLKWSRKSGFLFVATNIGIYIYCFNAKEIKKLSIMDFVKGYDIGTFCYGPKSGSLYFTTPEKVYVHSINKQFTMEVNPVPFVQVGAIGLDKSQTRLYVCTGWGLKIYDASEIKEVKEIAKIEGISCFNRIQISEKYLFGLSETGFISVIEIRPPGKERLTNTLTNIDCPSESSFLAFNEKGQVVVVSHRNQIVLISAKNVALFCGGNHRCKITAGIYDEESNIIGCADEEGVVILYNLSIKM